MNLSDRALLVQLSISQWTARKHDKRASKEVTEANAASTSAGRFNKSLLPMNDYLDNVHKKSGLIRNMYYDNTLPWGVEGTQMLPSANYLAFMTEFRKQKAEWEQLVSEFIDHYDYLKANAQRFLGTLYNDADYPVATEIISKFKMDMAVFPVPSNDFRVSIGSDELNRIQQDVERRVQEAQTTATRDVWQRLFDKVEKIAERLSDPTSKFRDSLIENAREMCELLPRLNFTDDPQLEAMRQEVESKLVSMSVEVLRSDPLVRRNTAADAKAIMDKMSVFMGAV
tara:strand:- start:1122 stop:1973 length:852 start_codon:yes stop_codon:yes gene_type:complete